MKYGLPYLSTYHVLYGCGCDTDGVQPYHHHHNCYHFFLCLYSVWKAFRDHFSVLSMGFNHRTFVPFPVSQNRSETPLLNLTHLIPSLVLSLLPQDFLAPPSPLLLTILINLFETCNQKAFPYWTSKLSHNPTSTLLTMCGSHCWNVAFTKTASTFRLTRTPTHPY